MKCFDAIGREVSCPTVGQPTSLAPGYYMAQNDDGTYAGGVMVLDSQTVVNATSGQIVDTYSTTTLTDGIMWYIITGLAVAFFLGSVYLLISKLAS